MNRADCTFDKSNSALPSMNNSAIIQPIEKMSCSQQHGLKTCSHCIYSKCSFSSSVIEAIGIDSSAYHFWHQSLHSQLPNI